MVATVVSLPVHISLEEFPDDVAASLSVNPLTQSLDNLIQDIDLGIDEMRREDWMPPPRSCCTSLGSNDVEIEQYCTCGIELDKVTSKLDFDSYILIFYYGEYRLLSKICDCGH